jgi:hypothetical protein
MPVTNKSENKFMLISRYSAFLSVVLLSAGAVIAAAGAPGGPQPVGPSGYGWPPMDRDFPAPPLPGERIEAELAYIKTALKLTDRQVPAWEAVALALRAEAGRRNAELAAHSAERNKTPLDGVVTIDPVALLSNRQHAAAAEAEALAKLLGVFKPFYAALTEEQREDAADLLPVGFRGPPPPMMGAPMPCPPPFAHEFP